MLYTVYGTDDGEIRRIYNLPEGKEISSYIGVGEAAIVEMFSPFSHWIYSWDIPGIGWVGEAIEKELIQYELNKNQVIADNLDELVISNLPENTELQIDFEDSYIIVDGVAEISFVYPKIYKIKLSALHYKNTIITVEAI